MLDEAENELEQRYAALAAARNPMGYPVYAIEHGMDAELIDQLREAASSELRTRGFVQRHRRVWTALAAEAGYRYSGEEFWPELEYRAGEWGNQNSRRYIRRQFEQFGEAFGGPTPVGTWAQHFNIISWPIANAVLPRYLQSFFATHLFEQRFALADVISKGTDAIGALLAENCRDKASRFGIFLQQSSLIGQIVLALRDNDLGNDQARIAPGLLARIVCDLETHDLSREQFRSARKVISTRSAIISTRLRSREFQKHSGEAEAPIIRARLAGRVQGSKVLLGVVLPDVSTALCRADVSAGDLSEVRVRLPGPASSWEPGETLLTYAKRERLLAELPPQNKPLVEIEGLNDKLRDALLELLAPTLPDTCLLKRHSDGLFREILGRQVRSGHSYLLVRRQPLNDATVSRLGALSCNCSTVGAIVYALELGPKLDPALVVELEQLNIGVGASMRIEPVGLMPYTDIDGLPVWASTEPVLFRLIADYPVSGFMISLNHDAPVNIEAGTDYTCISLNELEVGTHYLSVQAIRPGAINEHEVGFDFSIGQPEAWRVAMQGKSGFRLLIDPIGSELEPVLSGKAAATIFGPIGRSVHWGIETFNAAGQMQSRLQKGTTRVDAPQEAILAVIEQLRRDASDSIDAACRVDLIASIGELGSQSVSFAHAVSPVRWAFDAKRRSARLIDETDHDDTKISAFSLSEPTKGVAVELEKALAGRDIVPPGELLMAERDGRMHFAFFSAPVEDTLHNLKDLQPQQDFPNGQPDAEAILSLVRSYARWLGAKTFGPQASLRRDMTLDAISFQIVATACGHRFAVALKDANFELAQKLVGGSPGFGYRMRHFVSHDISPSERSALSNWAVQYQVVADALEFDDTFELVFTPLGFRPRKGFGGVAKVSKILSNQILVRGMFLAKSLSADVDAPQLGPAQ
jgi:hypothetical protein